MCCGLLDMCYIMGVRSTLMLLLSGRSNRLALAQSPLFDWEQQLLCLDCDVCLIGGGAIDAQDAENIEFRREGKKERKVWARSWFRALMFVTCLQ